MINKVFFLFLTFIPLLTESQELTFSSEIWKINAQGYVLESHHGYESLYLKGGLATIQDLNLADFELEFDIFLQERRSFSGIVFRMSDLENYEEIYFRGHLSGKPDAIQYTPVFNGNSAWQLYHDQAKPIFNGQIGWKVVEGLGYNNLYHYNYEGWTHVKLIVKDKQAQLFLDDQLVLEVADLKHGPTSGSIGFKSGRGGVHFANVSYRKITVDQPSMVTSEVTVDSRAIRQWSISSTFQDSLIEGQVLSENHLKDLKWDQAKVEANGLVNISRLRKKSRSENTVLASTTITVDKSEFRPFRFGYSDKVSVFLNGQKIYSGDNSYRSRDYRFLGTIGLFDQLYLPLEKGTNTLILAVNEVFGGWGIIGTFPSLN